MEVDRLGDAIMPDLLTPCCGVGPAVEMDYREERPDGFFCPDCFNYWDKNGKAASYNV